MATALVLLLLITMVSFYTSRTVTLEQKISANDFRSRQAFEAADSGVQIAMAYMSGGPDRDDDGVLDPVFDTDGDGIGDSNTNTFADGSSVTVTMTGAVPNVNIQSVGLSDDRTAGRTINAQAAQLQVLPSSPNNPLTTRGDLVVNGSATVYNPEGNTTIWSGADVDLGSNNSTATEIADPADADYPTCLDTAMTCGTTRSSNKVAVGLDVIENDASLNQMTADEMFANFFGMSPEAYRASRVGLEVNAADASNDASNSSNPGLHLATSEIVWVEGNTSISSLTVGCDSVVTGNNVCPNAEQNPSIIIVNGDLETSGTPHFYGLLFVMGDLDVSSNTTTHGAVVSAGGEINVTSGSLDVWYNSDLLEDLSNLGGVSGAPGSWRDW
jgi:hypothetical protein